MRICERASPTRPELKRHGVSASRKEKASKKIDLAVALPMACCAALQAGKPLTNVHAPIGVGRGLGAELRAAFGPLPMDKPHPDSTFGPAPAEERPNTGCAILYRSPFSYGADDVDEEGGYISQTGRRKKFPSYDY
jgi:hypothetical protein